MAGIASCRDPPERTTQSSRVALLAENLFAAAKSAEELQHFGSDDCAVICEDATRLPVQWKQRQSLAELAGRYVRLAFHLQQYRLTRSVRRSSVPQRRPCEGAREDLRRRRAREDRARALRKVASTSRSSTLRATREPPDRGLRSSGRSIFSARPSDSCCSRPSLH